MEATFFNRFESLCKERNTTPNAVAKAIGAASGSVTAWKRGTAPRNTTLSKIAAYFGVSTDYLLGHSPERADILESADIAFYGEYQELDEQQKQTVRDMVRIMLERRSR